MNLRTYLLQALQSARTAARAFTKEILKGVLAFYVALFWDFVLLLGCAVFVYGVWLAWRPAGFMTAGILLVAAALLLGPHKASKVENS